MNFQTHLTMGNILKQAWHFQKLLWIHCKTLPWEQNRAISDAIYQKWTGGNKKAYISTSLKKDDFSNPSLIWTNNGYLSVGGPGNRIFQESKPMTIFVDTYRPNYIYQLMSQVTMGNGQTFTVAGAYAIFESCQKEAISYFNHKN